MCVYSYSLYARSAARGALTLKKQTGPPSSEPSPTTYNQVTESLTSPALPVLEAAGTRSTRADRCFAGEGDGDARMAGRRPSRNQALRAATHGKAD